MAKPFLIIFLIILIKILCSEFKSESFLLFKYIVILFLLFLFLEKSPFNSFSLIKKSRIFFFILLFPFSFLVLVVKRTVLVFFFILVFIVIFIPFLIIDFPLSPIIAAILIVTGFFFSFNKLFILLNFISQFFVFTIHFSLFIIGAFH